MTPVRRIPELPELKKLLEQYPDMLNAYAKADSIIGSTDAIEYLNQKIKEKQGKN